MKMFKFLIMVFFVLLCTMIVIGSLPKMEDGPAVRLGRKGVEDAKMPRRYTKVFWGVLQKHKREYGWSAGLIQVKPILGQAPDGFALPWQGLDIWRSNHERIEAPIKYVAARRYLVLVGIDLGPRKANARGGEEIIQIIDLDKTLQEAQIEAMFKETPAKRHLPELPMDIDKEGLSDWVTTVRKGISENAVKPGDLVKVLGKPDLIEQASEGHKAYDVKAVYLMNREKLTQTRRRPDEITSKCPRLIFFIRKGIVRQLTEDEWKETRITGSRLEEMRDNVTVDAPFLPENFIENEK